MKRLVLLRPADADNEDYLSAATAHGLSPLVEPILSIQPVSFDTTAIPDDALLVATSANALRALAACDPRRTMAVVAVGPDSAAAASELGFSSVEAGPGRGAGLPDFLENRDLSRAVYLRGEDVSFDLGAVLRARGKSIAEIVAYRSEPAPALSIELLRALDRREVAALCLFSAKGAAAFAGLVEQYGRLTRLRAVRALCISDAVLQSVSVLPFQQALVAAAPDRHGMLELVGQIARSTEE